MQWLREKPLLACTWITPRYYDELYWDDPIMMIMYNSIYITVYIYRCIITWEFWSRQSSGMALMCNQQDHCFLLRTKGWTNFHWFIRKLDIVTMFHRLLSVFCAICTTEASSQSNGGQMSPHMPGWSFHIWDVIPTPLTNSLHHFSEG